LHDWIHVVASRLTYFTAKSPASRQKSTLNGPNVNYFRSLNSVMASARCLSVIL
jgi:hypothetical protein